MTLLTKLEFCKVWDISRPTLDRRLKDPKFNIKIEKDVNGRSMIDYNEGVRMQLRHRQKQKQYTNDVTYRWGWNDDTNEPIMVTLEEYVRRLAPLILKPVVSMQELDGDMLMSDYQKLVDAAWKIKSILKMLDENKQDK
jgi:hypothetical protein